MSQGSPKSPSQRIGISKPRTIRLLSRRRRGIILDYHIPRVRRARHHPWGHRYAFLTSSCPVVQGVARDGRSQTLQIGVFGRGSR